MKKNNLNDDLWLMKSVMFWVFIFMICFCYLIIPRCNNYLNDEYKNVNTYREWVEKK